MIKVIFLGTNGWFDTETGNTLCVLVETEKEYIVLDAGGGIHKLDRYIKKNKPIHLFLSHTHLDHLIGLHAFEKFKKLKLKQAINIYCPKGTKKFINMLIARPFSMSFKRLPFKVNLREVSQGKHKVPLAYSCYKLNHPVVCFGYRFDFGNKSVVFCTDTGVNNNVKKLAKGADLLILESAYRPGQRVASWPHLNPEDAATLAKEAKVRKLALVHFDAEEYKTLAQRKKAQKKARGIFKATTAATDGLEIKL